VLDVLSLGDEDRLLGDVRERSPTLSRFFEMP